MADIAEGRMEKIAQLLIEMGVPKNSAKALSLMLLSKGRARRSEIEGKTGLKQPEVSIAMKHLRKIKWVTRDEVQKIGKGRPIHEYTICLDPKDLIVELENMQKEKIEVMNKCMAELNQEILSV